MSVCLSVCLSVCVCLSVAHHSPHTTRLIHFIVQYLSVLFLYQSLLLTSYKLNMWGYPVLLLFCFFCLVWNSFVLLFKLGTTAVWTLANQVVERGLGLFSREVAGTAREVRRSEQSIYIYLYIYN